MARSIMKYRIFPLIPRVRVNFCILDLLRSLFVLERQNWRRRKCEDLFSQYFNKEYALLVGSGRSAIYNVLKSLPKKKVLIPAYTCMVVPEAATFAGKKICYMHTSKETFNSDILPQIDSDTIVIATHQFGFACDIISIQKQCNNVGAILVEDCAAAMGTMVNGKKVGTFGDYAIVSFNSTKLLNVPSKGGLIVVKGKDDFQRLKSCIVEKSSDLSFKTKHLFRGFIYCLTKNKWLYRCYHYLAIDRKGKLQRTEHETIATKMEDSYQYSFSEWQASILLPQIKKMNKIMEKRKRMFEILDKRINNSLLKKPHWCSEEVCCRYPVLVKDRIAFYKACLQKGVDMDFSHSALACDLSFEEEHEMANEILDVPFYYDMTEQEMDKVVKVVNSIK